MLHYVLFTHDDLDGAGCRIIFELVHQYLKKGTDYQVYNCSNAGIDSDVIKVLDSGIIGRDTRICFGDIVPSREVLERIVKEYSNPCIWDHHRTNFFATWVVPDATIIPENELGVMQSGTSLMYQFYSSMDDDISYMVKDQKFLAEFVDAVRSYDTYEWKSTDNIVAKKLQVLFSLLGMDRFCDQYVKRLTTEDSTDIISLEDVKFVDAKLENEQRIIDSVTPEDVYHIDVKGLKTAFALGGFGVNGSELAYQFLTKYPEFDMFAGFNLWRGGEFSFRCTRDDLDVGTDIALPIGGGGHPKASGAPLPEELREEIIGMLITHLNKAG